MQTDMLYTYVLNLDNNHVIPSPVNPLPESIARQVAEMMACSPHLNCRVLVSVKALKSAAEVLDRFAAVDRSILDETPHPAGIAVCDRATFQPDEQTVQAMM